MYDRAMTGAPGTAEHLLRSDARRNRAAILTAARELYAERPDVAMCEVARRAGVGQATLYRNFPDRGTLAAEVVGEHVDELAALAADHAGDADAFFILLRALIEGSASVHAICDLARADLCAGTRLEAERRRVAQVFKRPLSIAKAAGTLRRDATIDDVFLVLSMASGAMEPAPGPAQRATAASRVLTLTLDGLVVG
jgi:AcrR family transcriptional regulator